MKKSKKKWRGLLTFTSRSLTICPIVQNKDLIVSDFLSYFNLNSTKKFTATLVLIGPCMVWIKDVSGPTL